MMKPHHHLFIFLMWYWSVPHVQGLSRDWWRTGTRPFWHGGAASSGSCATGSGWKGCTAATNSGLTWLGGGIWSAAAGVRNVGNEVTSSVLGNGGHCQRYHHSSRWTLAAQTNGPNYDQQYVVKRVGFKNGTSRDLQISIDACISSMQLHSYLGISKQGIASVLRSAGNADCHVILRGGSQMDPSMTSSMWLMPPPRWSRQCSSHALSLIVLTRIQ